MIAVGTAGWAIPAALADDFGSGGSTLARYATRFDCVEINSSFHRRHRLSTWQRWAASVPESFAFSVKLPKTVTHERQLEDCGHLLETFAGEVAGLGDKLKVVLVQLPPKLDFQPTRAEQFFTALGQLVTADIACEPRHPSWFGAAPDAMLDKIKVARVATDPARVPAAAEPRGWPGLAYWRLHGSPKIYRSPYGSERLADYARQIAALPASTRRWCIFDNTASSAATGDALALIGSLSDGQGR